ncbi:MAG: thermonuclease family protein [Pyrinomonadaceae bacterium]|nr:thermonuclease family protein [Pyrinomonadaceae bacterium]
MFSRITTLPLTATVLLAFVALIALGLTSVLSSFAKIDSPEEAEGPKTPLDKAEKKAGVLEESEQREYDATVRVTGVVDGDTIQIYPAVDGKDKVRLIGVDTPETKDPECPIQPYGLEAAEFTKSQLESKQVGLEFDKERTTDRCFLCFLSKLFYRLGFERLGRDQRLLAYVYEEEDEEMFNERLLREGYARVETEQPNRRYVERLEAAQAEAQAALVGVWSLPSEQLAAFLSNTCFEETASVREDSSEKTL